jgi:hypothetical protein
MTPRKNSTRDLAVSGAVRTYEGRPLLPGEVPVIPYYAVPIARSRDESHQAAAALFDDLLIESAVEWVREDRWQISGLVDLTELAELVEDDSTDRMVLEHAWGDSGELIEQWFRTGEYPVEEAAPRELVSPEPSGVRTWFHALRTGARRIFGVAGCRRAG